MEEPDVPLLSNSRYGYQDLCKTDYFGVKWQVRTPNSSPLDQFNPLKSDDKELIIDVDSTPRCPKCETKLTVDPHFLWYTWYCPRNHFKKRTWKSNLKVAENVEKIDEREVEKYKEKS